VPTRVRTPCCDRLVTVPSGAASVVCSECNRRIRLSDLEDAEDDRPERGSAGKRGRSAASGSSSLGVVLLLVGGAGLLLLAICGGGLYYLVSLGNSATQAEREKDPILQPTAVKVKIGYSEFFGKSQMLLAGPAAKRAVFWRLGGVGRQRPRSVEVFDLRTGKSFGKKTLLDSQIDLLAPLLTINPQGDRLAVREDRMFDEGRMIDEKAYNVRYRIFVYALPDGKPVIERWAIGRAIGFMSLLDRNKLLTVDAEKRVESWDLDTRTPTTLATVPRKEGLIALSNDRRTLAAWNGSGFDLIPIATKGERRRTEAVDAAEPRCAVFSPNGERLAVTFTTPERFRQTVVSWSTSTGRLLSRGTADVQSPAWWGERHLVLRPPVDGGPGQLFDTDDGRFLGKVRFWAKGFLTDSPDGRLWLDEARWNDVQGSAGLVAFDPPNAEVLAAVGPQMDLNLSVDGVWTSKSR
jgi:hypothetical protein